MEQIDNQKEVSSLKWMRARVGLTQDDLARILQVKKKTISNWETGRTTAEMQPWQFKALLKALQITIDELPDSFAPQSRSANGQASTEG